MARQKRKPATRADAFLQGLGTSGGAIGSPNLVAFGAGDIQNQIGFGLIDNNAAKRNPDVTSAAMPTDLDSSYLKLNLPGSPLPIMGLTAAQTLTNAIFNQRMFLAEYQVQMAKFMPRGAQIPLPVGFPPAKKK